MGSFKNEFHHGYCLGIEYTVLYQSVRDKTSEVEVSVFLQSLYSSCTISSSSSKSGVLYINDEPYEFSVGSAKLNGNQKRILTTEDVIIQHDGNGEGSLKLSCSFGLGVKLGSTQYNTVKCPESGSRTIELKTITHNGPTVKPVTVSYSNPVEIDAYITNQSTVTLSIETLPPSDNADIESYLIVFGHRGELGYFSQSVYKLGYIKYDYNFLLPEIEGDSVEIAVSVTDTFGYKSNTVTVTLENILHYSPPTITDVQWVRGKMEPLVDNPEQTQFVEDTSGDCVKFTASGTIASLNNQNKKDYSVEYRVKGDRDYGELIPATALDSYEFTVEHIVEEVLSPDGAYDVRFIVEDLFGRVVEMMSINSQVVLLNFSPEGDSICAGGMATYPNTFQSWLRIMPSGGIQPAEILPGDSLDEVTTPGWYIGEDDEVGGAFGMLVEQIGTDTIYQCARSYDSGMKIYERVRRNDRWSNWSVNTKSFSFI